MTGLLLAIVAALVPVLAGAQDVSRGRDSLLVISFLDVGQGDAAMIYTGEGRRVLVDAGPSRRSVERHLWEGHDTLDLVVASHNHADHIGGMPWVFERFVVRAYLENGVPHTTAAYQRTIAALAAEPGVRYLQATDRTISIGQALKLRVLPPSLRGAGQNDNSVGLLVEFGEFRMLLTGDAERRQLDQWVRDNRIGPVHVLKASHHGARNGFTLSFARLARPEVVVIPVGPNSYGHPSPTVVAAWQSAGARVYRTDQSPSLMIAAKLDGTYRVMPFKVLSAPLKAP